MLFHGIDFANRDKNIGRCWLQDDGVSLQLRLQQPVEEEKDTRTAVDCPFGTSRGFGRLLQGLLPPDEGNDGYKTRETERWLRRHIGEFDSHQKWRDRTDAEKKLFPRRNYYHPTAHVQSTLGLQIVPQCLAWLMKTLCPDTEPDIRLELLASARRGDAHIVEAHPRPFLYSAIERLFQHEHQLITLDVLETVAGYKNPKKSVSHARQRGEIYRLLQQHTQWIRQARVILPAEPPDELIDSDHTFDAWLCCLTAWAHHQNQTIPWQAAGLDEAAVACEGHILVLSQNRSVDPETEQP